MEPIGFFSLALFCRTKPIAATEYTGRSSDQTADASSEALFFISEVNCLKLAEWSDMTKKIDGGSGV